MRLKNAHPIGCLPIFMGLALWFLIFKGIIIPFLKWVF
jgi:hypothetical protein